MSNNQINNKTENDYLEMANDCKNRLEERDKQINKWKTDFMLIKKEVGVIYGIIRSLNQYLEDCSPDICFDPIVEYLMNEIRRLTREVLFEEEEKRLGISTTEEFRLIVENLVESDL
tara:strand:+ start:337 stop:687 length:351 start_codon:yes stop_codon:yes gene_type:complete